MNVVCSEASLSARCALLNGENPSVGECLLHVYGVLFFWRAPDCIGVGPFATRRSKTFLILVIYAAFSLLSLTQGCGTKKWQRDLNYSHPGSTHPKERAVDYAPDKYCFAINFSPGAVKRGSYNRGLKPTATEL
jgi:hypothetical protein